MSEADINFIGRLFFIFVALTFFYLGGSRLLKRWPKPKKKKQSKYDKERENK